MVAACFLYACAVFEMAMVDWVVICIGANVYTKKGHVHGDHVKQYRCRIMLK